MKATPDASTRSLDLPGLLGVEVERRGAVDGLAGIAGRQDRQGAEPLARQHQHGVDVFALGQRAKAVDRRRRRNRGRAISARWATGSQTARTSKRSLSARSAGRCRTSQALPSPTRPTRSFILPSTKNVIRSTSGQWARYR